MSSKVTRWIRAGIQLCRACWRPAGPKTLLPRAIKRKKRRYWMIGKVLRIGANICRGHGSSLRADGDNQSKDVPREEEGGVNKKISAKDHNPNSQTKTVSDVGHKREGKVRTRKHRHKRRRKHSRRKMIDRLLCRMQARKNAIDLRSRYLDFQTTRNSDELGISELKKGLFSEKFFKAKGQDKRRHSLTVTQIDKEVYERVQKRFGHCKSAWTEHKSPRREDASVEETYDAARVKGRHGHVGGTSEGSHHGREVADHKQVYHITQDSGKEHEDLSTSSKVSGQNYPNGRRYLHIRGTNFEPEERKGGTADLIDGTEVYVSSSKESVVSDAEGDSRGVFNNPAYSLIIKRLTARCVGLDIHDDNDFCRNDCDDDYDGDVDDDDDDDDDGDEIATDSYASSYKMIAPYPDKISDEFSHNDGQRDRSSIQESERTGEDDLTNGSFVISVSICVEGHKTTDSNKSKDDTQDISEEGSSGNTPRTIKQEAGDWQDLPGYVQSQPQTSPTDCPEVLDPSAMGEQSIMMLPKSPLVGEQVKDFQGTMDKPPLHPTGVKKKKLLGETQGEDHNENHWHNSEPT
ncbi:uncharacterized protein [Haliotis asinina]|uniref:uncharacterized protein n=1 Tax=Haliotis asinina TaxID=109174 RepID=UPI0035321F79